MRTSGAAAMTYHPFAIANFFIRKAQEEGANLTPMKLQKLMYFAEGWNLAFREEELFHGEIQAWQYGPVIASVYREFKQYGNTNITAPATTVSVKNGRLNVEAPEVDPSDDYTRPLLDQIWAIYKPYTAVQLSAMTHEQGTPWHDVYVGEGMNSTRGLTIGKPKMRRYFQEALARNAQKAAAAGQ